MDKNQRGGIKITPQRKAVYEAMTELRHATIEDIIELVQSKDKEVTVSTIYRILDTFCAANVLSFIYHPDTGKCYYDITLEEHHHLFNGKEITDYNDPNLSRLIREYLRNEKFAPEEIEKIQVQITLKKNV
ncbi:MAG: Fur family transcriptional regulator [Bacteroidaceae bacterium]